MRFLSPLSLIWFLPLGAGIVVLYLLKLKRKERTVSSVLLWQDAVADIQANAPFQKLKKSLLLLLQLLALLMLVLAVARPFVRARGASENRIAVILDTSASMQSTDVRPSRFEDAKAKALDVVKRMGPGDTMLVITAGAKTQVVASFLSDKRALANAISRLQAVDTPCNMRQAMVLALSLVAGKSAVPPRIVVFSDGLFNSLTDLSPGKARIDFVRVGKSCDNVAITGMDSRKTLAGDQQVFVSLRNFSTRKRDFSVEVYIGDHLFDVREESLAPGEAKQEILANVADAGGRVTAKLDISDDLAADNSASVYLKKRAKLSILMVSKGNIFLQNALNLDPRTQLVRAEVAPDDLSKYDLVIFDRIAPPATLPPGGYLLVDTAGPQAPGKFGPMVQRPTIVDSDRKHPASAYVDFSDVRIAEARYLKPANWATTIIEGEGGALGAAGSKDGRRFVQLSFSLLESDFPLHVGFPIFAANCLDWLAGTETGHYSSGGLAGTGTGGYGSSIRTGQAAYIDVPPDVRELTVTDPAGRKHTVKVTSTPVIYENTEHAGVYIVVADLRLGQARGVVAGLSPGQARGVVAGLSPGQARGVVAGLSPGQGFAAEFTCNIASPQESSTKPKDALRVGGKQFASSGKGVQTNREFYGWLIFIALVILTVEWYAYHRRM